MSLGISLTLGLDEQNPALIAQALRVRSTVPQELYGRELQDINSELNQAIFYLAARGWANALIAEKLALAEEHVSIVTNSNVNKARIEKMAAKVRPDDPLNLWEDPSKFYKEVVKLSKNRLIALTRSPNDYVAATMLKEVNNRAFGKSPESVKVSGEVTLVGMVREIQRRRELEAA